MNSEMSGADRETVHALRAAMRMRANSAFLELAHASQLGGVYAERAMARRADALADVAEMQAKLDKLDTVSP